jgi:hypothetical protein
MASVVPSPPSANGSKIVSASGYKDKIPLLIARATSDAFKQFLYESGAITNFIFSSKKISVIFN